MRKKNMRIKWADTAIQGCRWFSFRKNVFTPIVKRYSTKVYMLLKFLPYDNPVFEFCFDLRNDLRKVWWVLFVLNYRIKYER